MKRFFAILAMLIAIPFTAHAAKGIHPGLVMASTYKQLKSIAQNQGFMQKGSGERLYQKVVKKASFSKKGTIEARITGRGGFTGAQKGVTLATGTFKVAQGIEGQAITSGKFGRIYYLGAQ